MVDVDVTSTGVCALMVCGEVVIIASTAAIVVLDAFLHVPVIPVLPDLIVITISSLLVLLAYRL